jgi:hypothetical protein
MTNQSSYSTQDLTGNWVFTTLYPGAIPQNIVYTGALSGQGANVTAVLRSNRCFAATQDIDFTGSEDAMQNLTLTSTNLPNNVVTITAALAEGNNPSAATLLVTGSGACSAPVISLSDFQIPSATGNYSGSITSSLGATASFTASLTQGAANADGQFPLTGTLTVTSATCTSTYPVATVFSGSPFTANLVSTTGPPSTADFTAGPAVSNNVALLGLSNTVITGCNAGSFTGSLNKQ